METVVLRNITNDLCANDTLNVNNFRFNSIRQERHSTEYK